MQRLNLGCGQHFLKEWTNLDFVKTGKGVIAHNLLKGIPFPDNKFDVVYHSHVLEHFDKNAGVFFIQECYRVLKPGGIIRIVIPDLEQIIKNYLHFLENGLAGDTDATFNYDWTVLELLDQMVRNTSGGEMGKYFQQELMPNEAFVTSRMGGELTNFRARHFKKKKESPLKTKTKKLLNHIDKAIVSIFPFYKYYKIGRFRSHGEIHQWMYDRFSLSNLLKDAGFDFPAVKTAFESSIPKWEDSQRLDVHHNKVRKPDSLFMEATKL